MEELKSTRRLLLNAVYNHLITTAKGCSVISVHPDTFKELVDETIAFKVGVNTIPHGTAINTYEINKLVILGIQVQPSPDVEVGKFEII